MPEIKKAYAISDAKISFVSLVDKAANERSFLIVKSDDGTAQLTTMSKIVKSDKDRHCITGVVYEPMKEDSHGNYMTEDEIVKAANWFAKNGKGNDIQHNCEPLDGAFILESYVTKSDGEIGGEPIKKGTWIMTVEVDDATFEKIEKGEITGFSMGGVGKYSTVDVDLPDEEGLITKVLSKFGLKPISKGMVTTRYENRIRNDNFYTAFYALKETLEEWDPSTGEAQYAKGEETIRAALSEFNEIVVDLLAEKSVTKALSNMEIPEGCITKAGKKVSGTRLKTLKEMQEKLSALISEVDDEKEDEDMSSEELTKAIEKAMKPYTEKIDKIEKALAGNEESGNEPESKTENGEAEAIEKAIEKAMKPYAEKLDKVSEAVDTIAKSRGVPTNLDDNNMGTAPTGETHYMHGMY